MKAPGGDRPLRVCIFGTFDVDRHPRVRVIEEGLLASDVEVSRCNEPWDAPTSARVAALRNPFVAARLACRLLGCWFRLVRRARDLRDVDVVIVGYLGVFDIHLARFCWRRTLLVLDHLAPAGGTVTDRSGGRVAGALARTIDRWAVRRADLVIVDTEEHRDEVQETPGIVVPVGAPQAWFETGVLPHDGPLRLIFYGLHTPLQGTPVMGRAIRLALEAGAEVQVTIVGEGQDLPECKAELGDRPEVTWLPWVAADDLPGLVAQHHVCLGIFGTTPKARRVVPNKVFQGAAAGCVLVTSDTPPQRRLLGEDTVFVPPGNASVLARELRRLADHRDQVETLRVASRAHAMQAFQPAAVIESLLTHVQDRGARG